MAILPSNKLEFYKQVDNLIQTNYINLASLPAKQARVFKTNYST